ncbi:phosphatidylserine decarboxylase family protein [Psychroflexus maritimus]|uniref:Phosphatidylserine decarboxylase family protein n=1 Tax=Psychroflexus maritimus TaxID=2714865 RepID=A0A967AGG3_9FLAO|nr:phosphatidylserine decarboxylase family protein [Psychroflexus maritimus]NGZ88980.1 phosphatidylserine decarboxylase family protein [Psychroflexus maritimus]
MFHKEGFKILTVAILLLIGINLITNYYSQNNLLIYSVFGVSMLLFLIVAQFFRNPKRGVDESEEYIVSPVDGKVVAIEEVEEKEYFKDKRIQVSIFMSPINVHVTRYPISGTVAYSKYHPGKFLVAWHPKSSEENERTTVVISSKKYGDVLYRQIAGALAKRIVNYASEGQMIKQGNDSGFIKFGSRVDLFLPLDANIEVELNQKMRGGESIISKI